MKQSIPKLAELARGKSHAHVRVWKQFLFMLICLNVMLMGAVPAVFAATTRTTLHLSGWSTTKRSTGAEELFQFKGTWDNPQYPAGCPHQPVRLQINGIWYDSSHLATTTTKVIGPCSALKYEMDSFFSCSTWNPWMHPDAQCSFTHGTKKYDKLNPTSALGTGGYDPRPFPSRHAMPSFRDFPVRLNLSILLGADSHHIVKLGPSTSVYLDTVAGVPYGFREYVAVNSKMHYVIMSAVYGNDKHWHYKTFNRIVAIKSDEGGAGARLILDRHTLRVGKWDVNAWYSWDGRRVYAAKHVKFTVRPAVSVSDAPVPKATLMSPTNGQILVNRDVRIEIDSRWRHKDNSKWEYKYQWVRYTTPRNVKSLDTATTTAWPDASGTSALPTQSYTHEVGGGTQLLLKYATVKPNDAKHIAWYRFRVREHYIPNGNSQFGYGPWSNWFSFGVEQPIRVATPITAPAPSAGQHLSRQRASQMGKVKFGAKVNSIIAQHHGAPPMHTLSAHVPSPSTPKRYARRNAHPMHSTPRQMPHLQMLQNQDTIDFSCANLHRFVTINQTLYNDGGPLAAGHAKVYVNEHAGAHLASTTLSVPAMAHGASTSLQLKVGTQAHYRTKVPGVHRLAIRLSVDGKTTISSMTVTLPARLCQIARVRQRPRGIARPPSAPIGRKLNPQPEPPSSSSRKLNPQPEPPSTQYRLKLPARE